MSSSLSNLIALFDLILPLRYIKSSDANRTAYCFPLVFLGAKARI